MSWALRVIFLTYPWIFNTENLPRETSVTLLNAVSRGRKTISHVSADLGGCYPPRPSASVDNTLLDLQNSSYPTQPHSIIANYSIIIQQIVTLPKYGHDALDICHP